MKNIFKLLIITILFATQAYIFSPIAFAVDTSTSTSTATLTQLYGGYHPLPVSATLRSGSESTYVSSLQSLLTIRGYYTGYIDGVYGPATVKAVASFQAANNLSADGVAGPKTIAALTGAVQSQGAPQISTNTTRSCKAVYQPVCGLSKSTVCNSSSIIPGSVSTCVQTEARKTYDSLCELENSSSLFLHNGKCDLSQPLLTPIVASQNAVTAREDTCISGYESSCLQNIPVPCVKAPCGNDEISSDSIDACSVDQPVCGAPQNYQDVAGVIRINNYKNRCQLDKSGAQFLYNGSCDANQPDKAISALQSTKADAKVNAELAGSYSTNVPVIQNTIVAQLQRIFKTLGYYTLPIDGEYGPATELAIQKYKASLGILDKVIQQSADTTSSSGSGGTVDSDIQAEAQP